MCCNEIVSQGISTCVLTSHPKKGLLLYKGKGRPNKTDIEVLNCDQKLKSEVKKLLKDMKYDSNTEVVLMLSICTDEMLRLVSMFPEVFFMDVTAKTNRQRRDLFLMVVKDAKGRAYPGNDTFIPSGQKWVFSKIYRTVFVDFFGTVVISRNRLALTDEDNSEILPFEQCIASEKHYKE